MPLLTECKYVPLTYAIDSDDKQAITQAIPSAKEFNILSMGHLIEVVNSTVNLNNPDIVNLIEEHVQELIRMLSDLNQMFQQQCSDYQLKKQGPESFLFYLPQQLYLLESKKKYLRNPVYPLSTEQKFQQLNEICTQEKKLHQEQQNSQRQIMQIDEELNQIHDKILQHENAYQQLLELRYRLCVEWQASHLNIVRNIPNIIKNIMEQVATVGEEIVIFGSTARILLCEAFTGAKIDFRKVNDVDIVTSADLTALQQILSKYDYTYVNGNEENNKLVVAVNIAYGVSIKLDINYDIAKEDIVSGDHFATCDLRVNRFRINASGEVANEQEAFQDLPYSYYNPGITMITLTGNPMENLQNKPIHFLRTLAAKFKIPNSLFANETILALSEFAIECTHGTMEPDIDFKKIGSFFYHLSPSILENLCEFLNIEDNALLNKCVIKLIVNAQVQSSEQLKEQNRGYNNILAKVLQSIQSKSMLHAMRNSDAATSSIEGVMGAAEDSAHKSPTAKKHVRWQ